MRLALRFYFGGQNFALRRKPVLRGVLVLALGALAGCQDAGDAATLGFSDEGTPQDIQISSSPVSAACTLNRAGLSIGNVAATPGTVTIMQTQNDITVNCAAPGYAGSAILHANVGGSATAGLLTGGIVDVHVYPDTVSVSMVPSAGTAPLAAGTPATPPRFGVEVRTGASGVMDASHQPVAGAFVQGVIKGSLADTAGVQPGDIIVSFNKAAIDSGQALLDAIAAAPPGHQIKLEVLRASYRIDLTVTF
ncbi:MAG: PDZ domain-containing protein [Acidocella sp.]|nr:PDZ domain-containing protein [Acidocella sp.]